MRDAERERDRKFLEQLKSPDIPGIPIIPCVIVDNASGWGNGAPRENRLITGYDVDDHEDDHGVGNGVGSLGAAMAIGWRRDASSELRTSNHLRSEWIIGTKGNIVCTTHYVERMDFPSSSSEVVMHCRGYRHNLGEHMHRRCVFYSDFIYTYYSG